MTENYIRLLRRSKKVSRTVNWNASTFQMSSTIGPAITGVVIRLTGHHAAPVYATNALAALAFCILIGQARRGAHRREARANDFQNLANRQLQS
jgi:predicted MFS family arabinose efflux permease